MKKFLTTGIVILGLSVALGLVAHASDFAILYDYMLNEEDNNFTEIEVLERNVAGMGEVFFIQEFTEEEIEDEHNRQLQEAIEEIMNDFEGDIIVKAVALTDDERARTWNVPEFGNAVLQNSGRAWTPWRYVGTAGYILNSGQSLRINPYGGSSVSVSVGFSWGPASISVSSGSVVSTGGILTEPSSAQVGRRVRPQVRNEIERREYRLYTSNVSANGPWTFLQNHRTNTLRTSEARLVLRP